MTVPAQAPAFSPVVWGGKRLPCPPAGDRGRLPRPPPDNSRRPGRRRRRPWRRHRGRRGVGPGQDRLQPPLGLRRERDLVDRRPHPARARRGPVADGVGHQPRHRRSGRRPCRRAPAAAAAPERPGRAGQEEAARAAPSRTAGLARDRGDRGDQGGDPAEQFRTRCRGARRRHGDSAARRGAAARRRTRRRRGAVAGGARRPQPRGASGRRRPGGRGPAGVLGLQPAQGREHRDRAAVALDGDGDQLAHGTSPGRLGSDPPAPQPLTGR